ncbi:hypothetical protein BJX99DRAFT_261347 [Aspergillus californicus]
MQSQSQSQRKKAQRASHACDFCHSRGLRCRRSSQTNKSRASIDHCLTCIDYAVQCTLNRPIQKRGRKSTKTTRPQSRPNAYPPGNVQSDPGSAVQQLIRIYRDTMYQCYFPFLPEKDLLTRWGNGIPDPSTDGTSYMLLMALCAVSSQTAALNAVFDQALVEGLPTTHNNNDEYYFTEAISKLPTHIPSHPQLPQTKDPNQNQDQDDHLDSLRTFGLLAVYSLRQNNNPALHRYLSLYHALVAQTAFHDESRWPAHISSDDVDDRRRLFWCVYRLEIHSACVFSHPVRMPEAQVCVLYPRITRAMDAETRAWTEGWDYITDLFRLLEYAIFCLKGSGGGGGRGGGLHSRKTFLAVLCDRPSPGALLDSLRRVKRGKPEILRGLSGSGSGEGFQSNRCMYMAVQIICTETLVTIMALLYCQAPAGEVMEIAEAFLDEVTKTPLIMFKVASSQIVHQLLGVGHMLRNASVYENGRYRDEAKRLITFLGDVVRNLEHDIPSAAGAGERLLWLAEVTSLS